MEGLFPWVHALAAEAGLPIEIIGEVAARDWARFLEARDA